MMQGDEEMVWRTKIKESDELERKPGLLRGIWGFNRLGE